MRRRSSSGVVERVDVGQLHAVDELECEHARACVAPVDARDANARVAGEVVAEAVGVARLAAVVELLADVARELVDDPARVDEVEPAQPVLGEARGLVQQRDVGLDLGGRVGALHLDRDAAAVREDRAVHLADRSGRDGHPVELEEEPLDRQPQLLLDHRLGLLVRERRHVVLQAAELRDDVRREDVRAGGEQLPELHERRPELVEHRAQVGAALRRRLVVRVAAAQAPVLEQVPEAVARGDLSDLRESPEVARRGRRHASVLQRPQPPRPPVGPKTAGHGRFRRVRRPGAPRTHHPVSR